MTIREVTPEDAVQICRIYNHYIVNTCVSFETVPVTEGQMEERIRYFTDNGFSYYVAQEDGSVTGFANIHPWKERDSYRFTREVTIYLDPARTGKGLGSLLFGYLLNNADLQNIHSLIAGISLPNEASVGLHEKFGFRQVAHYKEAGYKFGRWIDVGHWQLILAKH